MTTGSKSPILSVARAHLLRSCAFRDLSVCGPSFVVIAVNYRASNAPVAGKLTARLQRLVLLCTADSGASQQREVPFWQRGSSTPPPSVVANSNAGMSCCCALVWGSASGARQQQEGRKLLFWGLACVLMTTLRTSGDITLRTSDCDVTDRCITTLTASCSRCMTRGRHSRAISPTRSSASGSGSVRCARKMCAWLVAKRSTARLARRTA